MQQAINLEKEHGPDIRYSEYKIRRSWYQVDVKFMKYSGLHPMAAGHEDHRYEEVEVFIFELQQHKYRLQIVKKKKFWVISKSKCHHYQHSIQRNSKVANINIAAQGSFHK